MKNAILFLMIFIILSSCTSNFEAGKQQMSFGNYKEAIAHFESVAKSNEFYTDAQNLKTICKNKIDSINKNKGIGNSIKSISKIKQDSIDNANFIRNHEDNLIGISSQIKDYNPILNAPVDIEMEIDKFSSWNSKINEASFYHEKLSAKVEKELINLQIKQFPIFRKKYAEISKEEFWRNNIDVSCFGKGNSTIQYTGGLFANNANKQDIQDRLSGMLNKLRFKRVNYKWYKYDDEYTYYTLESLKDSEE
jgi:hypothetical protein